MKYSQCSVINCTAVKHYDQLFLDKQLSCASFLILKNGWGEEKLKGPETELSLLQQKSERVKDQKVWYRKEFESALQIELIL